MLAPGAVLQERYEITGLIGQGGMGAVYRAIDRRLGHTVAIKQILPQNQALRAAFEQEARLLAALRHPALPSVTDHFIETSVVEYGPGDAEAGNLGAESQMSSGHFLVMEYIPGDDLATLALRRSQPPGVDEVLRWADQLLDVLDYLHSRTPPVIHRDIKPHNLKINARGALVLLDFGLAKGAPGQAPSERSLAGYTLHYAAPEQLRGEPSDATSDLYSLAATLYDLLAASKPPDAMRRLAALASGQPDPLVPLPVRNPAVPLTIAEVIHQALGLDRQARFGSAAAMRRALHAAASDRESTQLVARARQEREGQEDTRPGKASPPHNLPAQLTSLVGREAEAAEVERLLQEESIRLVTLTGPGGTGKTRLSLAVAARCLAHFGDGVFFVSLSPIRESHLVLPTIAQTLGLRERAGTTVAQSLREHLQAKRLLLVLDNFEQVVSAAPDLAYLMIAAPYLKVLVTSREALQIRGEQEYPVPTLALPDLRRLPPLPDLAQLASVKLFVQRAQAVKPGFALTASNAAAVAEICKRLDGLPLAIELAATGIKLLSPQALLARLAERFELPGSGLRDLPDRQRTLSASIGWSYDLLSPGEQAIFRRLSIFAGSFALESAESICRETGIRPDLVLDALLALVGKSLLKPIEADESDLSAQNDALGEIEVRFTMLETIREFGLRRLEEEGEAAAVAATHAAHFVELAEEAGRQIWGAASAQWVARLDRELENLRAALSYLLAPSTGSGQVPADRAEASLRMAGSLWRFWEIRGYISEGRGWLERALQHRGEVPPAACWLALHGAGNLANDQDEYEVAKTHYLESLHLLQGILQTLDSANSSQGMGDSQDRLRTRYAISNTFLNLGHLAFQQSQYEEAVAYCEQSLTIHRQLQAEPETGRVNYRVGMAIVLTNLAQIKLAQSAYSESERFAAEALALYRQLGDSRGIGWNLQRMGGLARARGEYARAAAYYQEARRHYESLSNQPDMTVLYLHLGELASEQNQDEEAESAYRSGLALAQALGNRRNLATLIDRLGLLALRRGDLAEAAALIEQSIARQTEIGNLSGLSDALHHCGQVAAARREMAAAVAAYSESLRLKIRLGDRRGTIALLHSLAALALDQAGENAGEDALRAGAARTARLLAAAERLRQEIGFALPPAERDAAEALVQVVRTRLAADTFAAVWAEGAAMEVPAAVAYALQESA